MNKPVFKNIKKFKKAAKEVFGSEEPIDFESTEAAFAYKNDKELKKAAWLFGLMNQHWLVGLGSTLGVAAIKLHLPFVESVVKNTIFNQFCGGRTLLESQKNIEKLYKHGVQSILDYSVESKESEEDFNATMNEMLRAIDFAHTNESVPCIVTKVTGLVKKELLEKIQQRKKLSKTEDREYQNALKRIDIICNHAHRKQIAIFFDAEESWVQNTIDKIVEKMMERYNQEKVMVYHTFQMYRNDRLRYLKKSFKKANKEGYLLGVKLVRGAYMEKENKRAKEKRYSSPIYPNKQATDEAYNEGLRFCAANYEKISVCNASHNLESTQLLVSLMHQRGIPNNHPHFNFSQLYGMSDNLTFNLAAKGFNAAKYLPYGPVREAVPYLIRRAQENSSITGDMSREYELVAKELKRRESQNL